MEDMLEARTIHVPPLNLHVHAEKELSVQRLEPPLNSMNRACFRHAVSGIFISCSRRMSVVGVVCRNRDLISFLFLRPVNPWPKLLEFWVAIVIGSPFIIGDVR